MLSAINKLIYDRAASPLFSTFLVSWCVTNWKIFYLTFFIDASLINPSNKIEYIREHYIDLNQTLLIPFGSTLVIILIVPFLENGAYFVYLWFRDWRRRLKEESEDKSRLTVAESLLIKKERVDLINEHRTVIRGKTDQIQILTKQNEELVRTADALRVLYAGYGTMPEHWYDVTTDLQGIVNNSLVVAIEPSSFKANFKDEFYNTDTSKRRCIVVFQVKGRVKYREVQEGKIFAILPDGKQTTSDRAGLNTQTYSLDD